MDENQNKATAKIFFIEDDDLTIKTVKFVLEREGYEVLIARDGQEAIEMLDYPADLILLDLVLPQKNGFEVLKVIRQEKKLGTPVIVLSNLGKDKDVERALNLGANDYLIKNESSMETIVRKIRDVCQSRRIKTD